MSGYSAETGIGRVVPGQIDTIWKPRDIRAGRRGVVLLPGSGNPRAYMDGTIQNASMRLAAAIADNGIPAITCDFYNNSWARDLTMAAILTARDVLHTACPQTHATEILVLGGSMGGGSAARFSQLNPSITKGVVGLIPAYDIKYEYDNIPALVAPIEAAWGFTGAANFPPAANNKANVAAAVGVPILTYYAGNDTTVPATGVTGYHDAAGGLLANRVNVGNLGHTDAAIAAAPIADITRFLVANGA